MAKLSDLMMQFKKYFDQFGDCQVVFKQADNSVVDVLSCGMAKALNIKDEDITVCWLSGEFINEKVSTDPDAPSFPD